MVQVLLVSVMQKAFDVYQRDARVVHEIRIELEAFHRGVQWANNRSH